MGPLQTKLRILVLVVFFLAMGWALNVVYEQVFVHRLETLFVSPVDNYWDKMRPASSWYVGGWPLKYYSRIECGGSSPVISTSWIRLAMNVLCWIGIGLMCWKYELWMRPKLRSDGTRPIRQVTLMDLFVVTSLVALVFGYWRLIESRALRESVLATEITRSGGSVRQSVELPKSFAALVTPKMLPALMRITDVTLNSPSDELLQRVIKLPYLSRLLIGGGDYDLTLLEKLAANPVFRELRVSGRKLDAKGIRALSTLKQLEALNLARTNVNCQALEALGEMPMLHALNLMHTDVQLSNIGNPPWAKHLQRLDLPHPGPGGADRLAINGWDKLTYLSCYEMDELQNSTPVAIDLRNLPNLTVIELDAMQKFDLNLVDLPKLRSIAINITNARQRSLPSQQPSGTPWIRNLVAHGVPSLEMLKVDSKSIESISIQGAPRMALGFSSNSDTTLIYGGASMDAMRMAAISGARSTPPVSVPRIGRLIEDLGASNGPAAIDFSGLMLDNADLSSLQKNAGLRSLDLRNTAITANHLRQLYGFKQLRELRMFGSGLNTNGSDINSLATHLKNLVLLECANSATRRLELENMPNLEFLLDQLQGARMLDAVRLDSVPKLRLPLKFSYRADSVFIQNAPSLTGIEFTSPLPKGVMMSGLRDLKYFAGGGPALDDSVAHALLDCRELRKLTAAYSQISDELFAKLLALPQLEHIVVPGSQVTDQALAQIAQPQRLRSLNLENSLISDRSMELIEKMVNLNSLTLSGKKLSPTALNRIGSLKKLRHLTLARVTLSSDLTTIITGLRDLETLNLSGTQIDAATMAPLAQGLGSITFIDLRSCQLDSATLNVLLADNRGFPIAVDRPLTQSNDLDSVSRNRLQFLPLAPGGEFQLARPSLPRTAPMPTYMMPGGQIAATKQPAEEGLPHPSIFAPKDQN